MDKLIKIEISAEEVKRAFTKTIEESIEDECDKLFNLLEKTFFKVKYIVEYDSYINYYDENLNELTDLFEKIDYDLVHNSEGYKEYLEFFKYDIIIIYHSQVMNKEYYINVFSK